MSKVSLSTLKNWFKNGLKPTQEQFWNWMDSYWHKDETIPTSKIENLDSILTSKATTKQLNTHASDASAHGNVINPIKDRITALERKTIVIDGNEFRFLGADSEDIQINDIAASGIFEVEGVQLFGDLKCIDNTGDLTTGIETKWKPINKIII